MLTRGRRFNPQRFQFLSAHGIAAVDLNRYYCVERSGIGGVSRSKFIVNKEIYCVYSQFSFTAIKIGFSVTSKTMISKIISSKFPRTNSYKVNQRDPK